MALGVVFGLACSLMLKHSRLNEYPEIESCLIILIAYTSYFFSNGLTMSGAQVCVSLSYLADAGIFRHCVTTFLRYHAQALCLPQHVPQGTADKQVHVCESGAAFREFYLHLPWLESVHSDRPSLQTDVHCRDSRKSRRREKEDMR